MPQFDPSAGCDDHIVEAEKAFAREVAFWKEHRDRILSMAEAILRNDLISKQFHGTPRERFGDSLIDYAAHMVRRVVKKGEDSLY